MIGVGLIGFGRVGRVLFRELWARRGGLAPVAVSEVNPGGRPAPELAANFAYLLAHDSVYGPFAGRVSARDSAVLVDGKGLPLVFEENPADVDWPAYGVKVLVEASGQASAAARAASLAGRVVDKVVITRAASPPAQVTLVKGVNLAEYDPASHHVVSCSTCTANALAPVLNVLDQAYTVQRASLVSVHPALSEDAMLDSPAAQFSAGRSGLTVRPATSQMALTTAQVLPRLKGRLTAMSLRVPTSTVNGLVADIILKNPPDKAEEANRLLEGRSKAELAGVMKVDRGFLGRPRVAVDFSGDAHSSVVDAGWTSLTGNLLRLLIWHDNEYAYCCRVADILEEIGRSLT